MKRHRHTPEQAVRKGREGERLLTGGTDLTEVVRHLQVSEAHLPAGASDPHQPDVAGDLTTPGNEDSGVLTGV